VAAENQLRLRFSAVFDESPGKLENPATVFRPETKKPLQTKLKAVCALAVICYTPCKFDIKSAWEVLYQRWLQKSIA
jgi:hypothetical protein